MNKNFSFSKAALIVFGFDFLAMAIAIGIAITIERNPMRYFGENGYITWISVLQLLIIAVLCWKIGNLRKNTFPQSKPYLKKQPVIFWRISAASMFFFALDEGFEIHENLDKFLHRLFKVESTAISGRLDDFIILFYAITGLLFIYLFKNELKNFMAASIWFIWGLFFSVSTIFLDMLGHNRATFEPFADNLQQLNNIHHWFTTVEEIPKILAGGAFLVATYHCFKIAQILEGRSIRKEYNQKI